jgi:flagellar biosynthetic protein FlhB
VSEGDQDDAQEKSHEASQRKLDLAREQGDLPQSVDAQAAAAYLGLAAALFVGGAAAAEGMGEALMPFLERPGALADHAFSGAGQELARYLAVEAFAASAPVLLAPAVLVVGLLVAQRGIVLAPSKIAPKLSRVSPVENAGSKYGPRGLFEFAKSCVKLVLLLLVLFVVLRAEADRLAGYVHAEARLSGRLLEHELWAVLTGVLLVAPALGLVDLLWQRHEHQSRNRMSHEEMKKERRESEGDPHLKGARRERAESLAQGRMLEDVPTASVVITNPEHYAVALSWSREPGSAPVCIAKGVDEIAARIRERAEAAGVPMHADPPTARAIHATTALGAEIHPDHYRAVAAAILFADRIREKRRAS